MDITIRLETPGDYREVENLTREAFWDVYKPGCDEHLIINKLRNVSAFVKELDFIACKDDRIIGHIAYSRAKVINDLEEKEILTMGPVSVLPQFQSTGVGSLLINHSMKKARDLGYKGVIIFGNHNYYKKFGFENAKKYNITTSEGENFDEFMALELYKYSLDGIKGRFYVDDVFYVNNRELEEFDKNFPYKEKHITDTQIF